MLWIVEFTKLHMHHKIIDKRHRPVARSFVTINLQTNYPLNLTNQ